ncbi:MAG: hypothetical protein LBT14_13420 [Treponema sp.]|jgi:hypothetical protein|nr:hypothetical protein [Treponema sp.]
MALKGLGGLEGMKQMLPLLELPFSFNIGARDEREMMQIIYLFLSAEQGKLLNTEQMKMFEEIGSMVPGFNTERDRIISESNEILVGFIYNHNRDDNIAQSIVRLADSIYSKNARRSLLWMLVRLVYYYRRGPDNKLNIIMSLLDKWEIDKSIFDEMKDTAETYIALNDHWNWLNIHDKGKSLEELEKNEVELNESISNLIVVG